MKMQIQSTGNHTGWVCMTPQMVMFLDTHHITWRFLFPINIFFTKEALKKLQVIIIYEQINNKKYLQI